MNLEGEFIHSSMIMSDNIINISNRVTKIRFIVELVFGRIKQQFRIAAELLNNLIIKDFLKQLEILCAVINKYHPRVVADRGHEEEICERMISRMRLENKLFPLIQAEGLFRVERSFRVYNPREQLIRPLVNTEPYYLATGRYGLKLIDSYKARFKEMKLKLEVR